MNVDWLFAQVLRVKDLQFQFRHTLGRVVSDFNDVSGINFFRKRFSDLNQILYKKIILPIVDFQVWMPDSAIKYI